MCDTLLRMHIFPSYVFRRRRVWQERTNTVRPYENLSVGTNCVRPFLQCLQLINAIVRSSGFGSGQNAHPRKFALYCNFNQRLKAHIAIIVKNSNDEGKVCNDNDED